MSVGILLTIFSGLCWGGLDALRKRLASHLEALPLTAALIIGQWPAFILWVLLSGENTLTAEWLIPGLSVSGFALVAALLFNLAVKVSPLSLVIPMLSLTPVFAVCMSILLLDEYPTRTQQFGILLVVVGAYVLGRSKNDHRSNDQTESIKTKSIQTKKKHITGVWMMIGVAFCWACTLTLDKLAIQYADIPMHALAQSLVIGLSLLLVLMLRGRLSQLQEIYTHRGLFIGSVLLGCLATAAQLMAVRVVLVGVVEGIKRSIGLAMAVVNGRLFFDEPITSMKVGSIIVMSAGVFLLVL